MKFCLYQKKYVICTYTGGESKVLRRIRYFKADLNDSGFCFFWGQNSNQIEDKKQSSQAADGKNNWPEQ